MITAENAHAIATTHLLAGRPSARVGISRLPGGWRSWVDPDPAAPPRVGGAHLLIREHDGSVIWISAALDDAAATAALAEEPRT